MHKSAVKKSQEVSLSLHTLTGLICRVLIFLARVEVVEVVVVELPAVVVLLLPPSLSVPSSSSWSSSVFSLYLEK